MAASPEAAQRQTSSLKAHDYAKAELVVRHPDEYQKLVDFYRKTLGLPPARRDGRRSSDRPSAPAKL
jgi:hypothetical protein